MTVVRAYTFASMQLHNHKQNLEMHVDACSGQLICRHWECRSSSHGFLQCALLVAFQSTELMGLFMLWDLSYVLISPFVISTVEITGDMEYWGMWYCYLIPSSSVQWN